MAWRYEQMTGTLRDNRGAVVAQGYSGRDKGLNNPAAQGVANVGPIPVGTYDIATAMNHLSCGPLSMRLLPAPGTNTLGRDGFLIHGDTASMDHTASHGCIIVNRLAREIVSNSPDRLLVVVTGE